MPNRCRALVKRGVVLFSVSSGIELVAQFGCFGWLAGDGSNWGVKKLMGDSLRMIGSQMCAIAWQMPLSLGGELRVEATAWEQAKRLASWR